jgi:hypothetical protein
MAHAIRLHQIGGPEIGTGESVDVLKRTVLACGCHDGSN